MSAEELRAAARLMRERATAATNYPWTATAPGRVWKHYDGEVNAVGFPDDFDPKICDTLDNNDAQHIASWHPTVALAVADWLDTAGADLWAHGPLCACDDGCDDCDDLLWAPHVRNALTVARAYLGESA